MLYTGDNMKDIAFLTKLLNECRYKELFECVSDLTVLSEENKVVYITKYHFVDRGVTIAPTWYGYTIYNDDGDVYITECNGESTKVAKILRYTKAKLNYNLNGWFMLKWRWISRKHKSPEAYSFTNFAFARLKNGDVAVITSWRNGLWHKPYGLGVRYYDSVSGLKWNKYGRCIKVDTDKINSLLSTIDNNEDYDAVKDRFNYYGDGYDIDKIL